jgi:hypothetical protein
MSGRDLAIAARMLRVFVFAMIDIFAIGTMAWR